MRRRANFEGGSPPSIFPSSVYLLLTAVFSFASFFQLAKGPISDVHISTESRFSPKTRRCWSVYFRLLRRVLSPWHRKTRFRESNGRQNIFFATAVLQQAPASTKHSRVVTFGGLVFAVARCHSRKATPLFLRGLELSRG